MLPLPAIFRLRQKSLARGVVLSLGAFIASLLLAGFPYIENLHGSHWQIAAMFAAAWGMAETARCLQRKWSLYHGAVLLLLYTDLMILAMIVFMVAYPVE
ncbi:MAG: permease [Terracidiphilus sp.]